jgi:hypothetical protein
MSDWLHVSLRSRPLASLHRGEEGETPLELIRHADGATRRRRMARASLPLLFASQRLRALLTTSDNRQLDSEAESVRAICDDVAAVACSGSASYLITWPGGDRSHRSYVVVEDSVRGRRLFVKVSLAERDASAFAAEYHALEMLQRQPLDDWNTPQPIGITAIGERVALATECLQADTQPLSFSSIMAHLPLVGRAGASSVARMHARASDLPWFRDICEGDEASLAFLRTLAEAAESPLETRLAHCDIQPSNAVSAGGRLWLLDWEESSFDAPPNTDVVLGLINRQIWTGPRWTRRAPSPTTLVDQCGAMGLGCLSVVLALAFLSARGNAPASRLVREWPETSGRSHEVS